MNRDIVWTTQFKKDYKLAMKRHLNIELLDDIIRALSRGETLPETNKDYALVGDWIGRRECHIQPNWLFVYRIDDDVLVLTDVSLNRNACINSKYTDQWNKSNKNICS